MTHYDRLQISRLASPEVVRAAYRSLIQRAHPDRRPGDAAADAETAALTQAYEVLSDPDRRAAYDQALAAQAAAHRPPPPATGAVRRPVQPTRSAGRGGRGSWLLALSLVAAGSATGWLLRPTAPPASDAAELEQLRQQFAQSGQSHAQLQALVQRRDALLARQPALRQRYAQEVERDRNARTLELLQAPLVLRMGDGSTLTLHRVRLVLGSFETAALRAYLQANRDVVAREMSLALAAMPSLLVETGQLRAVAMVAVNRALGVHRGEAFRPTLFETPGRHGVIDLLLDEQDLVRHAVPVAGASR